MQQTHATLDARPALPEVRSVSALRPLVWIRLGARDLLTSPLASLFYGACLAAMGFLLFFYTRQAVKYIAALTSGFLLAGPLVAIGLYDISRRIERGQPVELGPTSVAWRENAKQLVRFGLVLGCVMLAWAGAALTIFAAFYGDESPTLQQFVADVLALKHAAFVIVYSAIGSMFAIAVFALSVVSIPMLLDRNCDALTALKTSLLAVARNIPAMAVWGALITALTLAGLGTFYLGLIITMPIVGHASWHAYRAIIADQPAG